MSIVAETLSRMIVAETVKVDRSKVPPFEKIWPLLLKDGDSVSHEIEGYSDSRENKARFHDDTGLDAEEEENEEKYHAWILDDVKSDTEMKYEEIVDEYLELSGEPCWRAMTLPDKIDPAKHQTLGIYWAVDEGAAEAHWGHPGQQRHVVYKGRIDLVNVDWEHTLMARLNHSIGDIEMEIRFYPGRPIYIDEVEVEHKQPGTYKKEYETIPVKGWRKT